MICWIGSVVGLGVFRDRGRRMRFLGFFVRRFAGGGNTLREFTIADLYNKIYT